MIDLKQNIQFIKGVGPARVELLNKLGIFTLEDLITYFPRDYEDRGEYKYKQHKKQWNRKHIHMFAYCIPEQIEQIENYQFAKKVNFDGWDIHHRLETHNSDGEKRLVNLSKAELIALDMYYNRPANELVFLTKSEHMKLHKRNRNSKANA